MFSNAGNSSTRSSGQKGISVGKLEMNLRYFSVFLQIPRDLKVIEVTFVGYRGDISWVISGSGRQSQAALLFNQGTHYEDNENCIYLICLLQPSELTEYSENIHEALDTKR